jgi:Zn finger protein HypA/HybF involved in hydrogenase expression
MPNYSDLLNVDDFWEKRINFDEERWDVTFYCKDCEEIVETERPNPNWYIFVCKKCSWKNIAIWTLAWIKENYRIK